MNKISVLKDMWLLLRYRRKRWMLPIIVSLLLLAMLLVFAQTSAFAPFIYTTF